MRPPYEPTAPKVTRGAAWEDYSRRDLDLDDGAKRVTRKLQWRERNARDRTPIASLYNVRLTIAALGVECSFDTFHSRMLVGFKGDRTRHQVVERALGDVTDNSIMALRQIISEHFGFDPTDKHVRDAVKTLALEHCFNPVADMLAGAERNWDGTKRLDRMAADYLNCEDTELNAACVRKTMIAAVARVRHPGCKFDTITVLESEEGFNKSTAWQILAGKENFSDEPIIGRESREVQEQLSGVWIHENADLAGMKKAEVETVKTFASRTEDRARPAFGHFLEKQPRHSIEVGTTNNSEYLQSQTGNRRFWPMVVLEAIDIEKLTSDRMQLWGEAAHYQSKGESLVLDKALWGAAAIEQDQRRVKDPWEVRLDSIETSYTHIAGGQARIASSDLLSGVLDVPVAQQNTSHMMRLAAVMKRLGWQRPPNGNVWIDGRQVKGWFRETDLKPPKPPPQPRKAPEGKR